MNDKLAEVQRLIAEFDDADRRMRLFYMEDAARYVKAKADFERVAFQAPSAAMAYCRELKEPT